MITRTMKSAWRRFASLWRPMAAWSVLTWGLFTLPLAPLTSYVLGWEALRGGQDVVGNTDILTWGATLPGVAWGLLAGGLALIAAAVQYAGLFHIITDDLEGRPPGLHRTVLDLAPRLPALFRLCVASVAAGAALALPAVGGLVVIKLAVLGEFDINYYLAERPGEWRLALVLGIGWVLATGLPTLYVLVRSALALPAYLDGHEPLPAAVRESWARTRGGAVDLARSLAGAIVAWLLVRAGLAAAYVAAGSAAINALAGVTDSLRVLVLATATYVLGLLALDAIVAFAGFAFVSTVLTKAYYEDTDLHQVLPPGPGITELSGRALERVRRLARPAVAIPAIGLLVAASALASGALLGRVPDPGPVIITAHRAGPPPAPENTLAALERAIDAGAHWAEIDVQRTADGVVVVAHDVDLMRAAGDQRRIGETPYAELADVVQRPDDGSPPAERRLATLAEFLERSQDRIGLLIELKYYGPDPELAPAVVREVRRAGMSGEVRVMSLDYAAVRDVERLAPRITTGYVAAAAIGDIGRLPVDFLAVARPRIDARLLRAGHRRGLEIHAWTVNTAAEMADLIERGVHGLITDHPGRAVRVAAEMADLSPAARLLLRFRDLWDPEDLPDFPRGDAAGVEPTPLLD